MKPWVGGLAMAALALLAACGTPPGGGGRSVSAAGPGHPGYKIGNPYQINGVWYYPAEDLSYDETGIASWYGEDFHGKYTANGEVFDLNGLTAAHRTLPMPSVVQITNLENGRTLKLRVNDRGPYLRGRIIDVSRRAAQLLGFEMPGTAKVRVRILPAESLQAKLDAINGGGAAQPVLVADGSAAPLASPAVAVSAETLAAPPGLQAPRPVQVASAAPSPPPPMPVQINSPRPLAPPPMPVATAPPPPQPVLPERVTVVPVHPTAIYVQAGAFSQPDNALRLQTKLAKFGKVQVTGAKVNGANLFRVRIGPLQSVDDADRMLDNVIGSGVTEARIVVN